MPQGPTGTLTFLFTDLEGSTRLWEQHPEAMRPALARHDGILRDAVAEQGGTTVKTTGDGIHAVFPTVDAAMRAAIAAQQLLTAERWGDTGPLRVRMGLHTGTAEHRAGDYFGPALNRAARLMAAAHGGQVVCSQASEELVVDAPPAGIELLDLGEHRLQDLARPERVFQVWSAGLVRDFPPLRSTNVSPGNLPSPLTSFIGRDDDLAAIAELLGRSRLVTLVGPAGVGKTRLALEAAAAAATKHPDGAWFVDLAPVSDPALVPSTVAAALGLTEPRHGSAVDGLVTWLQGRSLLVVLDNCEHLIEATVELVERFTGACPDVAVMVTSREALGVAGETTYPVSPLPLPKPGDDDSGLALDCPAVLLFAERAGATRHGFAVSHDNVTEVVELCRRLDGIPLALELAAARIQSMSPADILERLDERFSILGHGRRAGRSGHQTLRAAVDWSYELLDDPEQRVFARLSVFAGGFRLDAAEAVVSSDGVDKLAVLDIVDRLVARSMLIAEDAGSSTRYRLLETLREYGWERLADTGDLQRIRRQHAAYFSALANESAPHLVDRHDDIWSARLNAERDNLQAALEWAEASNDSETLVRMVCSLGHFWWHANNWRHGYSWFEKAATRLDAVPEADRPEFLAQFGHIAIGLSQWADGQRVLSESMQLSAARGEPPRPLALVSLSTAALDAGHGADAVELAGQARDAAHALGERFWYGYALATVSLAIVNGTASDGVGPADEAVEIARELQNRWLLGIALMAAGIARHRDDPVAAVPLFEQAIVESEPVDKFTVAQCRFFSGMAYLRLRRYDDAARELSAALELMRLLGGDYYTTTALAAIAALLYRLGEPLDAVRILAALESLRARWGIAGAPIDVQSQRRLQDRLAVAVPPERFDAAWTDGQQLGIDGAVALASRALRPPPPGAVLAVPT
jgi:predicted ATPase/class 3 adenylate cyclase